MVESSNPMWRRIWVKMQTTLFGGAMIVGSTWIVSKALGFIRLRLILSTFGPSGADPIYTALAIPDFIYGTLILGSLLSAFMPVFITARQQDKEEAWRVTRRILAVISLVFVVFGLALLLGAPLIVRPIVGQKLSAASVATAIQLTRIMSMNMLLFAAGNVFAGVLQSFRHFIAVSMAPIVNNLGMIFGLVFLTHRYGAAGVAYGAVIGAAGLFSIQAIAAWRLGFRFGPLASWRHSGVRQFVHLLLPRTLGQSVTQIDQFVNVPIATRIGPGNLTIFRLANDIQDAPISIIGVSMATVAFPVFIELLSQNRRQEFIEHFSKIVRQILFLIIPMTVLLLQLRAQVTRLVGGTHLVSWPSTITAAQTLGFFALSFFAQSLIPVLARSFYAMKDTKTPVRITIAAVGLDIVGSIVLGHLMGVKGLALSFTISNILNAGALLFVLRQRLGSLDDERMFQSVLRVMGVTILMALTVQAAKYFLVTFGLDLSRAVGVLAQAVVAGLVGVLSYMIFAALFRLEEASLITQALQAFRQMIVGQRPSNGQDAPTI